MAELRGSRVLVTGGAGFIGSHLVDALVDAGAARVHVIDDGSLGRRQNLAGVLDRPEVVLQVGDCADASLLEGLDQDFDLCFHLAVIPLPHSLEHPRENVERNVAMTTAVCELGRQGGWKRLISFSSSEVYGSARTVPMSEDHPLGAHTPYAAAKAAGDLVVASYAATFGLEVLTVRPFNTYGQRQNDAAYAGLIPAVVRAVEQGRPVGVTGDGEQTRDMSHVSDTVAGALALARCDDAVGGTFNLGSGQEASVNETVALILDAMGRPDHPVEHLPERPGDVRRLLADTARVRAIVGHEPRVSLAEGLAATVAWYRDQGPATPAP